LDVARIKDNFARVATHGDEVALFFYSDLFLRYPETRELFPVSMAAQRDHLLGALARIVAEVDSITQLTEFLQELGRDHRKFGTIAGHYEPVGASMMATLAHFSGPDWTDELAADWEAAYQLISGVMIESATLDEKINPPYWDATVLSVREPAYDIGLLKVATLERLNFQPGQSVAISCELRPRLWRFYSIANAPRENGTLEFHIRIIDGGSLSLALGRGLTPGNRLRLGPPVGSLTYRGGTGRDVLLVGGSTGLAPLKAITEQLAGLAEPPATTLVFGARTSDGLYDLPELEQLSEAAPWLTLIPCVRDDADYPGERGSLPDVVARSGEWPAHDAYVAGPSAMVAATVTRLETMGVPAGQIHTEDFGWSES
jgi:NAD(P)H-flavin reductase/hemoglobin-like flavoprotein